MVLRSIGYPLRLVILVTLVLIVPIGVSRAYATSSTEKSREDQEYYRSSSNEYVLIKYLVPVLNRAGQGAQIYYDADCSGDRENPHPLFHFPYTNAQPPSESASGLVAVQEIFRADHNVQVSENPLGVINIVIGKPFTKILETHITEIKLEADEHYNPKLTIDVIRNNPEVQVAAKTMGIRFHEFKGYDGFPWYHKQGDPFLSGPLKNMTLDQALNLVAKELKIIVLYGSCSERKYVSIDHTGGPGFHVSGLLP